MLGGPNVGKSSLLNKVLVDGGHDVVSLELRSVGFTTPHGLHKHIQSSASSSWKDAIAPVKGLEAEIPEYIKLKIPEKNDEYNVDLLIQDLDRIGESLPPFSVWRGRRKPVLFIDEANDLKNMSKNLGDEGDDAINAILKWMVKNTKQDPRLHVVMASSDSFFLEWLNSRNIGRHADVYTVGDLFYEEAENFYQLRLEGLEPSLRNAAPSFGDVYEVLGGRMFHIQKFVRDFSIKEGALTWDTFAPLRSCISRIEDAFSASEFEGRSGEWAAADLIKTMTALHTDPSKHSVLYKHLKANIGEHALNSLIRYNIVTIWTSHMTSQVLHMIRLSLLQVQWSGTL